MTSPPYRGRFAPSPTGPLHLGSLAVALASWLRARQAGGTWLIRIEDLDPPREVAGAAALQLETLARLGLESDELVQWQSRRAPLYEHVLDRLRHEAHTFECRCSRNELAAQGGVHRRCTSHGHARAPALRVRVPDVRITVDDAIEGRIGQDLAREVGDFVLRRVDGLYAYQLAVVVDDAAQGITEVVRGGDLLDSTPRQRWLQRLLGYPEPAYVHLPLVRDADGKKLSKSLGAAAVDASAAHAALHAAWRHLGQDRARLPNFGSSASLLRAAIDAFELERVPRDMSRSEGGSDTAPV